MLSAATLGDDPRGRVARKGATQPSFGGDISVDAPSRRLFDFTKLGFLASFIFAEPHSRLNRAKPEKIISIDVACRDFRFFKLTFVVTDTTEKNPNIGLN
jgi:hypothetical protein